MKPVIALVGRPNVGKSTLFNRMTKTRDAIVADYAGLTRDRHYGNGSQGKHEYIVIDTGGFEPDATSGIYKEMAKQTRQAVAEADVVVFVVDARAGVSAQDHEIAKYLRKLSKPCVLVANKAEGMTTGVQLGEFFELGLGEVVPVSAAHGQGIRTLVELALEPLHLSDDEEMVAVEDPGVIKLAVAGRPNVGKSTLINTWLGEERLVALTCPAPHATPFRYPSSATASALNWWIPPACAARARFLRPLKSFRWSRPCRPLSRPAWCCC
jgi:GTP-binding protein